MARVGQRHDFSLTPELWAKVFALVEKRPETIENIADLTFTTHRLARQEQAQVHQLKLVCKQFRDIYATHSGLTQRMFLYQSFPARLLPGLLAWVQQNKISVQIFQSAEPSSLMDAVLTGLVLSEQYIRLANLRSVSACSISLIATFRTLEKCGLWSKPRHYLDLAPLGSLPVLTHLDLPGDHHSLHHLAGLTWLVCTSAAIDNVQQIAPSLQHLEIKSSTLTGMHSWGLSLCTGLTQLVLGDSILTGNDDEHYWDNDMTVVPVNIVMLTQLHTLHLSSSSNDFGDPQPNFGWVSQLTSLQDLTVICDYSHDQLLQHALLLTNLTRLHIAGIVQQNISIRHYVKVLDIDIEWHRLQALQELLICNYTLCLGQNLDGLLQLQHLKRISLSGSTVNEHDMKPFIDWHSKFVSLRPQVQLDHDLIAIV